MFIIRKQFVLLFVLALCYCSAQAEGWFYSGEPDAVSVNVGPSWITSNIEGADVDAGFDMDVSYEHVWYTGWGIGADMMFHHNTIDPIHLNLFTLGPSAIYAHQTHNGWRWDAAVGMGFAHYNNVSEMKDNGFGYWSRYSIGYMFGKYLSFDLRFQTISMFFSTPSGVSLKSGESYGYERASLTAGVHIFF